MQASRWCLEGKVVDEVMSAAAVAGVKKRFVC